MKLITRADDAGSSHSANRAILQCATQGMVRNISLMAPGVAIQDAAQQLAHLKNVDFGLHVTLNSEWQTPRWGPVSPLSQVPDLVENDGCFTRSPMQLFERGFTEDVLKQCETEICAQLKCLRELGFEIRYIDEHMGVGWLPGLRARLQVLAQRENLIYWPDCPGLPLKSNAPEDFLLALQNTPESTCLSVFHPTFDDAQTRAISADFIEPNQIARERDADRQLCVNRTVIECCQHHQVVLSRYSEVRESIENS